MLCATLSALEVMRMPHVEVDDDTDGYLEFAANIAGLTKGEVVARLVEQARAVVSPQPEAAEPSAVRVHADYAGHRTTALFTPGPGRIEITSGPLAGQVYRTPSEAARRVIKRYKPGVSGSRNGWSFWVVTGTGAQLQSLRHASR